MGFPSRRPRHIHVQTQEGKVYTLAVDRGMRMRALLKFLHSKLNVLPEQSQLVYKGEVVGEDLSTVCEDMPVLLLPKKMKRSLSTPCLTNNKGLSVTVKDTDEFEAHNGSVDEKKHCFSIVRSSICATAVKPLLRAASLGVKQGNLPIPEKDGHGGSYFFRGPTGKKIAIVKPTDEEPLAPNNPKGFVGRNLGDPGLKKSVRVGEAAYREAAAFLLDHDGFARVPRTAIVTVTHSIFCLNEREIEAAQSTTSLRMANSVSGSFSSVTETAPTKLASFQEFVAHVGSAEDQSTSRFSVGDVHRLGIFDVRLFNMDRHAGNILVRKKVKETRKKHMKRAKSIACNAQDLPETHTSLVSQNFVQEDKYELVPIDHGYCLPETLDEIYFEWLFWPQASQPFSKEEIDYVAKLDVQSDIKLLRDQLPMLREASLRMLEVSTTLLQRCVAYGLSLAEIGTVLTRPLTAMDEEPSEMEILCMRAVALTKAYKAAPYRNALCNSIVHEEEEEEENVEEEGEDEGSPPGQKEIPVINGFCVPSSVLLSRESSLEEDKSEIVRQNGFVVKRKNLYKLDDKNGLNSSYRNLRSLFDDTTVFELDDESSSSGSPIDSSVRKLPFTHSDEYDMPEVPSSLPGAAPRSLFQEVIFAKHTTGESLLSPSGTLSPKTPLQSGGLTQQLGSSPHVTAQPTLLAKVELVNRPQPAPQETGSRLKNSTRWSDFSDDDEDDDLTHECSSPSYGEENAPGMDSHTPTDSISFSYSSNSDRPSFAMKSSGYTSSEDAFEDENQDVLHDLPSTRSNAISIAVPLKLNQDSSRSGSQNSSQGSASPVISRSMKSRSRTGTRESRNSLHRASSSVHSNGAKSRVDPHVRNQRDPGVRRISFSASEPINLGDMENDFWRMFKSYLVELMEEALLKRQWKASKGTHMQKGSQMLNFSTSCPKF